MSAPISRLTDLPTEILEQVFLHLPGQDIVKIEAVSRQLQDLTRNSPILRHKRDLFSAGLVETSCSPTDFSRRRRLYEDHERKWSNAGRAVNATHELPKALLHERYTTTIHGGNLIAYCDYLDYNSHNFLRLPPTASQKPIEQWSVPPFPFLPVQFVVYLPESILAAADEKERFIYIHFFNLSDGSPCSAPPSTLVWELPQKAGEVSVEDLFITGSRVMMHLYCREAVQWGSISAWVVVVWDWKTGDLVLDLSSTSGHILGGRDTTVTFLDEFRVMVLTPNNAPDPEFALFDTLVPCNHQAGLRQFSVPQLYYGWSPTLHIDDDRYLGTRDRLDSPLTTDPAQAILVIKLANPHGPRVLLIVRIQTLIERAYSMSPDALVPWEEWGRGVAVMEVPGSPRTGDSSYPLIQGVRAIWATMYSTPGLKEYLIRTFDFSRRGWSTLPLLDQGSGTERKASFEEGRQFVLQGYQEMDEWGFESLGGGRFMHLDDYSGSECMLHIWELV